VIIDSSAIIAILLRETGFEQFERAISKASVPRISAAGFVEVSIVIESRGGAEVIRYFESIIRQGGISVEAVSVEQAWLARDAYSNYGKGRHSAGLNFGDCFSYALAKATGEPLLFKGDDFRKTDVIPALP
jgi:ribonuclease VapC